MTAKIKIRKKSGRKKFKKTENLGKKELAAAARQRLPKNKTKKKQNSEDLLEVFGA